MIKQFVTLSFVLLFGLVAWSAYERSTWDEDYTKYPLTMVPLAPLDNTFEQHIDPTYFKKAIVITNDTHLRYPEDLAVDAQGTIYTGLCDGSIVTVTPASNNTELLYKGNETGRVYGLIITSDDSTLFYLTEFKGLVKLDIKTKEASYLLSEFQGKKTGALNSVCIDEERQILYITESGPIRMTFSTKEIILGHEAGKIFAYDLKTAKTRVILDKIAFANGIAYEKETNSVIFAELTRYKIWRYRLSDSKKEVLIENLFGFPDNLKLNDKGQLLVGIPSTRSAFTEKLLQNPLTKKLAMYLPERVSFALNPKRAGGIRIDTKTGKIVEYLFGAPTKTSFVTSIVEKNGKTYFASLKSPTILVLDPTVSQNQEQTIEKETEL